LEAVKRVHLDVHCQQVTTTVGAVLGVLAEKFAGAAFADETSEDIRKRDDDGVDLAPFDFGEQGLEIHGGYVKRDA
jgi:hypothetical protein